jgi:hypothetical protein
MLDTSTRTVLACVLVATSLGAQSWVHASPPTSPPPRATHAMATDPTAGRTLLFGGYSATAYLGDTWAFDGTTWSAVAGPGPSARSRHAMAFDEGRGRVVLFGGMFNATTNGYLGDTWEHANGAWQQRSSSAFPPVRFGHAMAYDRTRSRVVMFGGRTRTGTVFLNDTWEWDGTSWTPLLPAVSPSRRMGHALVLDPGTGKPLLFGGMPLGGPVAGDTWRFDGATWTQLAPLHSPSPRMDAAVAPDFARGRIVLYGGYDGTDLIDTMEWDGSDWLTVATTTQPGVPVLPAMASSPTGAHVVLFGGEDSGGAAHAETWTFGHHAAVHAFGSGCGSLALAPVGGSLPRLGQSFQSAMTGVPLNGMAFQSIGLSDLAMNGVPLPLDLAPFQMPGCSLYHDAVALFLPCSLVGGTATHTFLLPNHGAFAGMELFLQGYVLATGSNPAGLLTSNALELDFGF